MEKRCNRLVLVTLPETGKEQNRSRNVTRVTETSGFNHRLLQTCATAAVAGVDQQVAAERHNRELGGLTYGHTSGLCSSVADDTTAYATVDTRATNQCWMHF